MRSRSTRSLAPLRAPLAAAVLLLATGGLQAQSYDMLDYMRHDNQNKAILLTTNDGQTQVIRSYNVTSDRFYITKNYNPANGQAPDYEEYMYDSSYIYLVRDTSWQSSNWCGSLPTSFELWTGGRNRGARFPRFVANGGTYTPPGSVIKARLEGNGCGFCDSPVDSNGQTVSTTYRFDKLASKMFSTGQTVYDLIKVTINSGPGAGEVYYFAKALGFVGYEDPYQWSYYSGVANNGNDFQVTAQDACPGATGCTWYQSRAANVYHQTGEPDGYDWSANVWEHSAGYLSYGPYDSKWGVGRHAAHFYLMIDNRSADNAAVLTIDVVSDQGRRVLARRNITRQEFTSTYTWQWFTLNFDYPSFEQVEVRVYWHDNAYIKHGGTHICK